MVLVLRRVATLSAELSCAWELEDKDCYLLNHPVLPYRCLVLQKTHLLFFSPNPVRIMLGWRHQSFQQIGNQNRQP